MKANSMAAAALTKDQLLQRLRRSDRPVTRRQLERWSKAGHMDRPTRRHVPGIRGSVSFFPSRAVDQAAALYDAAQSKAPKDGAGDRRLDERAFVLWWARKPIVHDPRKLLLLFSAPLLNAVQNVRAHESIEVVGLDESEDPAFDIADAYFQEHPPERFKGRLFSALSSNLSHRPQDLVSVMTTMTAGALGGITVLEASPRDDDPSLASLVLQAFGFAQFPSTTSPEEQVKGVLRNVSFFANRDHVNDFVRGLSDEELDIARKCTRSFFEDLPAIFEAQGVLFGKSATAKILRAFSRMATIAIKASTVVGMAWLLRQEGRENALRLVDQIKEAAPMARGVSKLTKAFPEYRKLFLQKNLDRLTALPEETRQKILTVVKSTIS